MSVQRTATGHSIRPSRSRFAVLAELPRFWRHPLAAVRRWRWSHRYPRPADLDRMDDEAFEVYLHDIGFDTRITAAIAESDALVRETDPDQSVRSSEGVVTR